MFDAYTIKKVLPRLVAAVILIQLSWFIFGGMIELMANISYGLEGLLLAPFGGADAVSLVGIFNQAGLGVGAGIGGLALAGTVGVVAAGGPIGMLILVGTALLVGFLVLVVRRVLLVALLLFSPIALVAWILPGTERLWKLWWENFSKLLLMFPLILIIMTVGRVFAYVYASTINQPGIMEMFVIVICVFAPIAMIPLTYKAAGIGLGFIAGAIKGGPEAWGKGTRERRQKKRAEQRAAKWGGIKERAQRNALFNPNSGLGRFNAAAGWISAPGSNLAYAARNRNIPFLSGKGRSIAAGIHHKQMEQTGKAFSELNNMFGSNDKAYRALSGAWHGFSEDTQQRLVAAGLGSWRTNDEGKQVAVANENFGSWKDLEEMQKILAQGDDNERIASSVIHGAMPRLNTMFSDPEMGYANLQAAGLIGMASHGFANDEDLEVVGNQMLAKNGGDLGAVQGVLAQAELGASRAGRADIKPGYGHGVVDGKIVRGSKLHRDDRWVDTMTASDLSAAKGNLMKDHGKMFEEILRRGGGAEGRAATKIVDEARRQGMTDEQIAAKHGADIFKRSQLSRRAETLSAKLQVAASSYGGGVEVSGAAADILARGGYQVTPTGIDPALLRGDSGTPPPPPDGGGGGDGGP